MLVRIMEFKLFHTVSIFQVLTLPLLQPILIAMLRAQERLQQRLFIPEIIIYIIGVMVQPLPPLTMYRQALI